jgi:hypothetical protein
MQEKSTTGRETMDKQAIYQEALSNAVGGQSLTNYRDIFEGFIAKGIPIEDIKPRVNVYTYNAWRALGRFVKKGEHGVKILTFIQTRKEDKKTGEVTVSRRPWTTTVFHPALKPLRVERKRP